MCWRKLWLTFKITRMYSLNGGEVYSATLGSVATFRSRGESVAYDSRPAGSSHSHPAAMRPRSIMPGQTKPARQFRRSSRPEHAQRATGLGRRIAWDRPDGHPGPGAAGLDGRDLGIHRDELRRRLKADHGGLARLRGRLCKHIDTLSLITIGLTTRGPLRSISGCKQTVVDNHVACDLANAGGLNLASEVVQARERIGRHDLAIEVPPAYVWSSSWKTS